MAKQTYKQPNKGSSSRDDDGMYHDEQNSLTPGGQSARDASSRASDTIGNIDDLLDDSSDGGFYNNSQASNAGNEDNGYSNSASTERSLTPSQVGDAEASAASGSEASDSSGEIPFRQEKQKRKLTGGQLRRRGLIVGILTLVGGGGFLGLSFLSGPAMIIQYGEALAHIKPFQHQDDAGTSRLTRALRWAKTGDVGETRMNGLESSFNKYTVDAFAKRGITLISDKVTGQFVGAQVDTNKMAQYDGMSPEERKAAFAASTGVDPANVKENVSLTRGQPHSGVYKADISSLGYSEKNNLLKSYVKGGDYGPLSTTARFWSMKLRFNLSNPWLHPLKAGAGKLDQKIADSVRAKAAKADEESRLKKLVTPSEETKAKIAGWREDTKGIQKGAAVALIATAVLCSVKEIAHSIPEINRVTTVVPALVSATDAQGLAGQTQANQSPIAALGGVATSMTAADGSTPFQSPVYTAVTSGNTTKDVSKQVDGNLLASFQSDSTAASIDQGLDSLGVGALCSTAGQFIQAVVGGALLLTGVGGLAEKSLQIGVGVATGFVLADVIKSISQGLSDDPLGKNFVPHQGKQGGTVDALGDLELANSASRTTGGTQLSMPQVAELDKNTPDDFATQSFASRMFNIHDYRSLASKTLIQNQNPDGAQNVASAFSSAFTSITKVGSVFSGLGNALMPHASAAPSTPFGLGIPEYGFSEADLENPLVANPFDNAAKVGDLLDGSDGQSYIDKAKSCFDDTIAKDGDGNWDVTVPSDDAKQGGVNPTSADYKEANCDDTSDNWLRIRMFVLDTGVTEGFACVELNDDQSCTNDGFADPAPADSSGDTDGNAVESNNLPVAGTTGNATKVITVQASSESSTTAKLQTWTKGSDGTWTATGTPLTTPIDANLGTKGMTTKTSESVSATPEGSFTLTQAFGSKANPGTFLPYHVTDANSYWISQYGGKCAATYNTYQETSKPCVSGNGSTNEHLVTVKPQYNYAVAIDANTPNAPGGVKQGGGSAFFLHVSDGNPTAGCVSIPESQLTSVMKWLDPTSNPRILIGLPNTQKSTPSSSSKTIVLDPGHDGSDNSKIIDKATGLQMTYTHSGNVPEVNDVYDVATIVQKKLQTDGYTVLMTKSSAKDSKTFRDRANVANNAHAALAVSIHDQAGANGGIKFTKGNNIVYYQSVGTYRKTPGGKKVSFTNGALAATSKKYGETFQQQRQAAQGTNVALQANTGYDLGSRGLAPGNIWMTQLFSNVPWIYNEAGGNSAGQVGLNKADKQKYANGLIRAIEATVPIK